MRRILLLCLGLFGLLGGHAKEVTKEYATQYAQTYLQTRSGEQLKVQRVEVTASKAYYIINFAPQGWVVMATDDVVSPVVAYSTAGYIDEHTLPANMSYMLQEYERQMQDIKKVETKEHPRWRTPQNALTRASRTPVEPLILVNWNQSEPYNVYCPQKKALVGCVAVAMGQAMSVQRYPSRPRGEMSYSCANYGTLSIDFNAERAYNWDDIMSGANNCDEVARFLFHAGMSVKMRYGEDASGVLYSQLTALLTNAMKEHFSYPEGIVHYVRDYYDDDWEQLIVNELNAGRAVIYNAIDSQNGSGHSFNIDGCDSDGNFHVNWGWGGYGNGYFILNGLRDQFQGLHFDVSHLIVCGIGAPDQVLKNVSLSNARIEEGLEAGANVGSILVNGESPKSSYRITVHGTYNSKTGTYYEVPFIYEDGMLKTTEKLSSSNPTRNIEITVEDLESQASLTQGFRITVEPWKSLEATTRLSFDRQTRLFTLTTKHNVSYVIKNEAGMVLEEGALEPLPELEIDANKLPAGSNSVELRCADEIKKFQIISQ